MRMEYLKRLDRNTTETKTLKLISDMIPESAANYSFTGQLYLADSNNAEQPMNGVKVGDSVTISFSKTAESKPSLKVSGNQIGTNADWVSGQKFKFEVAELPDDSVVTVTAYSGASGNQKATDVLSSVGGQFDITGGTGTYNKNNGNGLLKLSSVAPQGTYRLVFEVKSNKETILTVPYYIVVK